MSIYNSLSNSLEKIRKDKDKNKIINKCEHLVNLGEGYEVPYTIVIVHCLKLFQKIYLKRRWCRNNFEVLRQNNFELKFYIQSNYYLSIRIK